MFTSNMKIQKLAAILVAILICISFISNIFISGSLLITFAGFEYYIFTKNKTYGRYREYSISRFKYYAWIGISFFGTSLFVLIFTVIPFFWMLLPFTFLVPITIKCIVGYFLFLQFKSFYRYGRTVYT